MKQALGILGGLGPLASAEFLKTIYEYNIKDLEQESPICILYSDPTFPDRTDAILEGADDLIVKLLVEALEKLCQLGVSKIAIACITMHYFLPKVPLPLREKVISLIDLIITEVLTIKKTHLLLCSVGTREAGIFQQHPQWKIIEEYVLFPDKEDQLKIQNYIYQAKNNYYKSSIIDYIDTLTYKYKIKSFIIGCTEFHSLGKSLKDNQSYQTVDPLVIIANKINDFIIEK